MDAFKPFQSCSDSSLLCLLLWLSFIPAGAVVAQETPLASPWDCTPVDPLDQSLAQQPCFRALLSNENQVILEWRVAPSAGSLVYVYDDIATYEDIGFKPAICASGPVDGCSITVSLSEGGFYRWVLAVLGDSGEKAHVAASIEIPAAYPPIVEPHRVTMDMLDVQAVTFSWFPDTRNNWPAADLATAWIELRRPGNILYDPTHYPRFPGAGITVGEAEHAIPGDYIYAVRECHMPAGGPTKFCSREATVGIKVGPDHFLGLNHLHTSAGQELEVSFSTNSGDVRLLSSETLVPPNNGMRLFATQGSSYTIAGALLTPGLHRLELVSCSWSESLCSNREDADRAISSGWVWHTLPGYFEKDILIAAVIPDDSAELQLIYTPATGYVFFENDEQIYRAAAGAAIAYTITSNTDFLQLVVDGAMDWDTDRDYTEDFLPGTGHAIRGPGMALDLDFDDEGGVWQINEFANNIEHLSPDGVVETINLPLARDPNSTPLPFAPVRPFTFSSYGPSSISSLGERAVAIGSMVWFTQGGGLQLGAVQPWNNHSRIISFDRAGQDSPATAYDDRLCVYNLPTDNPAGVGNNEIIGLTAARGRIWVAESRGLFNLNVLSAVSSFVPDPAQCENLLNFADPAALQNQDLQYCAPGQTPEQDGCLEKLVLFDSTVQIRAAHLARDPLDDSVWFTDARGKVLGNINPDRSDALALYHLEDDHSEPDMPLGLGGFPWSLRVDANAVYFGEYLTRHIIRFDKATESFHEIHVPYANAEVTLHSLDLDSMRNRLWFTLSNERNLPADTTASTIGYVDLTSWQEYVENPGSGVTIPGVIYKGLSTIPCCENNPDQHQVFRGIAVDPGTGRIALATSWREQITLLTPKPGFWP